MMNSRTFWLLALFLLIPCTSSGKSSKRYLMNNYQEEPIKNKWQVHFRVSDSELDMSYNGNSYTLNEISGTILNLLSDSTYNVLGIVIEGFASPEGPIEINELLSLERAQVLKHHLMQVTRLPEDRFEVIAGGENWRDLKSMIYDSDRAWRFEVLNMLDNLPPIEDPEVVLRNYKGGTIYQDLLLNFFPKLRCASSIQIVERLPEPIIEATEPEIDPVVVIVEPEPISEPIIEEKKCYCEPPIMGIRMNAVNWALLIPNIGLEFYMGNRFSVAVDGTYRWFQFSGKRRNYTVSTIMPEARVWLRGQSQFTGSFFGLYGRYGEYDVKLTKKGYQGYMGGAGLSYGYVWRMGRKSCFFFELGASAGVDHVNYARYHWFDETYCAVNEGRTKTLRYGLTRLNASFLWRF